MNWIVIIVGIVAVVGFFAVVGLVRSIVRIVIAMVAGVLTALAASWLLQAFNLSETIPDAAVLAIGALGALSVLVRRR